MSFINSFTCVFIRPIKSISSVFSRQTLATERINLKTTNISDPHWSIRFWSQSRTKFKRTEKYCQGFNHFRINWFFSPIFPKLYDDDDENYTIEDDKEKLIGKADEKCVEEHWVVKMNLSVVLCRKKENEAKEEGGGGGHRSSLVWQVLKSKHTQQQPQWICISSSLFAFVIFRPCRGRFNIIYNHDSTGAHHTHTHTHTTHLERQCVGFCCFCSFCWVQKRLNKQTLARLADNFLSLFRPQPIWFLWLWMAENIGIS